MNMPYIDEKVLYDKIYACWLGKNIGGTLGEPVEGTKEALSLTFYPKLSEDGALPNDDLDLQLVNLHALEERGVLLDSHDLSQEWLEHVFFPFDEYGYALTNIRRGLLPPLSGYYNNPFRDCMGSHIRSELWAAIAPGRPDLAVYYAYQDSLVDHAGGEGMYGEMFFAALESLAFVEGNILKLIEKALTYIPNSSRTYRAVSQTLAWFLEGVSYEDVRGYILDNFGNPNFTDAPQNIAFTMVGLLYGNDFEDGILKAVNLGYDTDCTGATLGSIYGILYGSKCIPKKWSDPIGDIIVVSPAVNGFDYPLNLKELTRRTLAVKHKVDLHGLDDFVSLPSKNLNRQDLYLHPNTGRHTNLHISIDHGDKAYIIAGEDKRLKVTIKNQSIRSWDFFINIKGGYAPKDRYTLDKGESLTLPLTVKGYENSVSTNFFELNIQRLKDDSLWTVYPLKFAIPLASVWRVNEKIVYGEDGFLFFDKAGKYTAQTRLNIPTGRKIKLMCSAGEAVYSLYLNGKLIIDSKAKHDFIPAYHRVPSDQFAEFDIEPGLHDLNLQVETLKDKEGLMVCPLAPNNTREPGACYYYIDCIFSI